MSSKALIASAVLVSGALAAPGYKGMMKRQSPDGVCPPTLNGQPYIAEVKFYDDADCNNFISSFCSYVAEEYINGYGCEIAGLPETTPFYAQVENSAYPSVQLVYTQDQSCPPNGPGAVFATLIDNKACVEFNKGGDVPGLSVYPNGGAEVAREPAKREIGSKMVKRDAKCSGFNIESQQPSSSQSVQVSSIVDCTNGADSGCMITVGSEHTESVTTSYSVTAGGGIEGLFEVSATFGMDYTESSTTTMQEGFSVQPGQKGYLSAYSAATLFKGTYTGCDSGDAEQPGEALVIKKNGFTYAVVNTGA